MDVGDAKRGALNALSVAAAFHALARFGGPAGVMGSVVGVMADLP